MTTTTPTGMDTFHGQKIEGGKVHVFTAGRSGSFMGAKTFCTGRTVSGVVSVNAAVDCVACVKRAAKDGIDVS